MLLQDIRFGLRTALKNKAVTGLAITCLAIGIGLNTMMFSVTDGVLIQPLPYQDPDNLVVLNTTQKQTGIRQGSLSWLDLQDWKERSRSFTTLAGIQYRSFTVSDGGDSDRYAGAAVSHDLFAMFGKPPQLGRGFSATDDRPGAEPVVLISDDFSRHRYNADPSIVGRAIQVNSRPHTVVGVMPPQFKFPENQNISLPLAEFAVSLRAFLYAVGVAGLTGIVFGLAPALHGYWQYFRFGWMFSLYGGIALVLASIGVYGVLSYSVAQRTQEIGVRMALGAGRRDVLKLVVLQGIKLAIAGIVVGVVGSFFITPIIGSMLVNVSATDPLSFIGVSFFLTSIAFLASYVPARRAMAVDPLVALRAE